jgi:pilus assembly protein Flp/PilA
MRKITKNLAGDKKGATAIEYGLIAALVAVAIVGGLSALGPALNNAFKSVSDTVTSKTGP